MNFFHRLKQFAPSRPRRQLGPQARPGLETLESRLVPYSVSGSAWVHSNLITISFMPDGTSVNGHTSNLFAIFNAKFGSAAAWQNQILKAAQQWAQQTNINFAVVPDSGAASGSGSYQQGDPTFGDIRIGGNNFGSSTIAQAFLPPQANNYSIAGDLQFNTAQTFKIGSTYDLYTVAMHEFGHALGLYHSTTTAAVMYGTYTAAKPGLATDDVNAIRAIYGTGRPADSYGSSTAASNTAPAITASINTTTDAGVLNNLDLTTSSSVEWFKFVVPAGSTTTLNVVAQSTGLSLLDPYVQIYDSSLKLKTSGNAGAYGGTAAATYKGVSAGQTYYIKVYSTDALAAFKTGNYALILNLGAGVNPTPTRPNTQTANGSPLMSGGGQALLLSAGDTLANTTTTGAQQTSSNVRRDVAADAQGNYVVTWQSYGPDAANSWGIYAQLYNSSGVAQGGEFRVNTTTAGDQTDPSVAMAANGNFVVVWTGAGQDGSGLGVYGQLYNSSGVAQGGEFRINTTTAGDQSNASAAMAANGNFVVVWTSAGQDGSGLGVYGQLYNSSGVAQGSEFRVNTTTAGNQTSPSVAMAANGSFTVAWASYGQDAAKSWGIYGQLFNSSGVAQGGEFRVNTTTAGDQTSPSVAMAANGSFTVAWASYGQDAAKSWGIYAQRYSAQGVVQGGEFRVNTTTAGDQVGPSAAIDSNGNILVTWSSYGQDGSGWGVYGQIFGATDGARIDGEFRVNTTTSGDQQYASAAVSALGQAVVVWSGNGPGDGSGVFFQHYDLTRDALDPPPSGAANPSGADVDPTQTVERWVRAGSPSPLDGSAWNAVGGPSREGSVGSVIAQIYGRLLGFSATAPTNPWPAANGPETSRFHGGEAGSAGDSAPPGEGPPESVGQRQPFAGRIRSLLDPSVTLYRWGGSDPDKIDDPLDDKP